MDSQQMTIPEALQKAIEAHKAGKLQDAERIYRAILQIQVNHPDANHNLGILAVQVGKPDESLPYFKLALETNPKCNQFWISYIDALVKLERTDEALSLLNQGKTFGLNGEIASRIATIIENYAEVKKEKTEAYLSSLKRNVMNAIVQQFSSGNYLEAETMSRDFIQKYPTDAFGYMACGSILVQCNKHKEAVIVLNKGLQFSDNEPTIHNSLGLALQYLGNYEEAFFHYKKALAIKPDFAEAFNNMGNALQDLSKLDEALAQYQKALQIKPDFAEAHNNIGNALKELGKSEEALLHYKKALEIRPDYAGAFSNLLFNNSLTKKSQQILYKDYCTYSNKFEKKINYPHANKHIFKSKKIKIKIGYVSGDFRHHSVSYFIKEVFANHNHDSFDIYAYTTTLESDDFTTYIKNYVNHWKSLVGLPDEAAAELIYNDRIDILVDLSGHTQGNRLLVFARKPAPIQITWLGFLNTTGLKNIDYILSNRWMITEADIPYCSEKPWYFDGPSSCFWNEALEHDIEINKLPALSNKYITFGCFNKYCKINNNVLMSWINILKMIPHSRLFCKNKLFEQENIKKEFLQNFVAELIDSSRIILEGDSPVLDFLRSHNNIDISLDTFPYNGGTITCHSLSMGVPVLSIKGDSVISHVGESFLRPMGLDDWIAENEDDYVAKAISWSNRLDDLANLRMTLRQRFKAVYGDSVGFTKKLEDAYRLMWEIWCDKKMIG